MAVTARDYGQAALAMIRGQLGDLTAEPIRVALLTNAYTPNVDAHTYFSDVNAAEVVGAGYTAGGAALTGVSGSYDAANHRAVLAAGPVTFAGASFTARYAVAYIYTGNPATSRLLSYVDFGVDRVESAIDFVVTFASGVSRINV